MKLFFAIVYIRIITLTMIFHDHPLVEYPLYAKNHVFLHIPGCHKQFCKYYFFCNDGVKFKRVFGKYDQAFPRLFFSFLTFKIKSKHFSIYLHIISFSY